MSITATIQIEHNHLALVPTLRSLPEVYIRVVAQGNTNPGETNFPFLIEYHDRKQLEDAFQSDLTVREYKLVDWTDDSGIYYIEHSHKTKLISTVVTDVNGFLMHAETRNDGWLVRLLLPDRQALNTIWEFANEEGINLDIIEIYGNEDASGEQSFGLTSEQRDALQFAYEAGYFNEPRDISLEEVAENMGLSSTAMSGRLRRGMRNLIAATIDEERTD